MRSCIYALFVQLKRKLPKVNRDLAARLLKEQEAEDREGENADDENMTKKKKKNKGISSDILKDERFAILFENKVLLASYLLQKLFCSYRSSSD